MHNRKLKKSKSNQLYWKSIHKVICMNKMLGQYHIKIIKAPHLLKLVPQTRRSSLQLKLKDKDLLFCLTLDESLKAIHSGSI